MNFPRSWSLRALHRGLPLLLIATPALALAQISSHPLRAFDLPSIAGRQDLAACRAYRVTGLPGSHQFAADFLETIAADPAPTAKDADAIWALSADLDSRVPKQQQAIYLSKSTDGGRTWTLLARIDSRYYDANISEGLRNGLAVTPGGGAFVITTQEGAFEVLPRPDAFAPIVEPIPGPRVPSVRPDVTITKKSGDPVRAGVVLITADGSYMVVAYGYFDDNPQLFTYRRNRRGLWLETGTLPHLPTDLDIFSMQFDNPRSSHPGSLYVGTGDQAYRLDLRTLQWTRVAGVGPDSAIHAISTVAGLHLAACWGVYNPVSAGAVTRVTNDDFLLHRGKDEAGPNIRAYGIAVDPRSPNREVLAAITGVYISSDRGQNWKRLNGLPEGEFHSAYFNSDGTVIVSGFVGTFLVNPFSSDCSPQLRMR
ncbi:MAG TPA: hypothetical protein VHZ09_16070 [Acidobacteriaceae bacterium]|jgi:hypothetical protein|nr:hypothetical protein [Acidobacteriaceae bacterium]